MPALPIFVAIALVALAGLGWLGRRVTPQPFPPYPEPTPPLETFPVPDDLPAPVARYYAAAVGEAAPLIHSAVITGRGRLRFKGITLPARWRFIHDAGHSYRHYIETTVFGWPLLKVNESYVDGNARLELPFGTVEGEPTANQAANLGLWGESIWLPSLFLADPRARWEPIDDRTARLVVPFEDGEDNFTVHFDPETGLLTALEAMRYKDGPTKVGWRNEVRGWARWHGVMVPSVGAVIWEDEGTPWLMLDVEDVVYNVNVSQTIRARGA